MAQSEVEIVQDVYRLFRTARQQKRNLVAKWNKNRRVMRNRTWGDARASWLPSPQVPEIYPIIAACVGWVTDQRPILSANPGAPPGKEWVTFYQQIAQDMSTCLQTAWVQHQWDAEIERMVWDAYLYGVGFLKTTWDGTLLEGMGDVSVRRLDPFSFFIDPRATSMKDANYFVEARNITLEELERRFPGSTKQIDEPVRLDVDEPEPMNEGAAGYYKAMPGTINNPAGAFGQTPTSTGSRRHGKPGEGTPKVTLAQDETVTYFELWQRDVLEQKGKTYDRWSVTVIAGNKVLLRVPAVELWSHARHPYSYLPLIDTGDFWGMSMVELLTDSQLSINRLLAALQQNIELVGNPVFVEDTASNLSRALITNRPGQRIQVATGGQADWLKPPPIHPMFLQLIQFHINEMERVSGLSAMQRGYTPTGRNSTEVLDSVQEAGFVRIRLVLRNLERCLRDAGNLVASLVAENYSSPRIIQTVGPSTDPKQQTVNMRTKHFYTPDTEADRIPMRFNILIDANSSLATSRAARVAEADLLYTLGAIDDRALLDAHEFPNREEVLKRVQPMKQAGLMQPPGQRQGTRAPGR